MKNSIVLRLISITMLAIAIVFVVCALSAPNLGQTTHLGSFEFGAEQWRLCYAIYAIVMINLFVASFLVKKKQ